MSFLDRINECNAFDPANFVPFVVAGRPVGLVKRRFARRLEDFPDAFAVTGGGVTMAAGLDTFDARTAAADFALRRLADSGDITGWRDEPYPVGGPFAGPHPMAMERAAIPFFGVRAYGVHVNGFARRLADFPDAFAVSGAMVTMAPGLDSYDARTLAAEIALRRLADAGDITGWRDEPYPVGGEFAGPHAMAMERCAIPLFGVRAYGVHVNGFVRDDDGGIAMWIARRAAGKQTYPGMLDNMIAGGQPIGIGPKENVIKEAAEEAAVPHDLASRAIAVGIVTYRHETADGIKPDVMYAYDLELPRNFRPANTDGEIAEFYLWPVARVMETVAETREFKFNCNLIIIDFLVRHGLIGPDDPDYIEIVEGLRR